MLRVKLTRHARAPLQSCLANVYFPGLRHNVGYTIGRMMTQEELVLASAVRTTSLNSVEVHTIR